MVGLLVATDTPQIRQSMKQFVSQKLAVAGRQADKQRRMIEALQAQLACVNIWGCPRRSFGGVRVDQYWKSKQHRHT